RLALCRPCFFLSPSDPPRFLHSFPTRRSSDLVTPHTRERSSPAQSREPSPSVQTSAPRLSQATRSTRRKPPRNSCSPTSSSSARSEEHTSELQSRGHLVCRLLLEKKNATNTEK